MFFHKPKAKSFIINDTDERVKVGDSVLVPKSPEEAGSYVGLVTEIRNERSGLKVCVKRYLTPEETLSGRISFYGKKELLLTREFEFVSAHSIQRKCFVHSCFSYARLKHVGLYDYFSRFEYHIGSGHLSPDQVAVFCKCDMPFNPDQFMLKCRDCKERFHPGCINMTDDEANQIGSFTCDECRDLDVNLASSDPALLEIKKLQLEEQARAQEERRQAAEERQQAAEERERAEKEHKQAVERARAAEERERAAKKRQQEAEERQRAATKQIKELEERVKESANRMITLKEPPFPPQDPNCDYFRILSEKHAENEENAEIDESGNKSPPDAFDVVWKSVARSIREIKLSAGLTDAPASGFPVPPFEGGIHIAKILNDDLPKKIEEERAAWHKRHTESHPGPS